MIPRPRGNASHTMRRDPIPPAGDDDPLDAALGELADLAELEQRFAMLDARIGARGVGNTGRDPLDDDEDPFSDIARALREHRAEIDSDAAVHELDDALSNEDDEHGEHEDDDDPVAAEIEELCQNALDALDDDDDANHARELAMQAVRLDDEHPFPMFVLGLIAEREGDLDTARDMAELSLRTAGTNADAIGLRAHIHVRHHELAEAEELLRYGIAHNPDDASLHEGLARVALARGHHEDAVRAARAALRLEPGNPGAMAVRTAALEESVDRGALLAALRQGVQLHPADPYAMLELASVEMEHGNVDRARMLLVRAQRLAPRDHEITNVRALVEHVYERPMLRPVPGLMRWMNDFPGGLPGFLVGFVIAALPLHALAMVSPQYRLPAIAVIVAWGVIALYAWLAPAMLTRRLNQRAAAAGAESIERELRDPLAALPDVTRLVDVLSMLGAAHDRAGVARLATRASERAVEIGVRPLPSLDAAAATTLAPGLLAIARSMRGAQARLRSALLAVPLLPRMLVAIATACAVMAPALANAADMPLLAVYGFALAALLCAWLMTLVERAFTRDLDAALLALEADSR